MTIAAVPVEFCLVRLERVDDPKLPSRTSMNDEKLEELAENIRANGLLQPLLVARVGDRFEVVAGHRRRIACQRAGLMDVPCLVYPGRDDALDAVQAAENYHREDLSPGDEALWFSDLLERKCGGDIEKLCGLVGHKLSYVDGRLALFHGCPEVFAALQRNEITIGVAHELNKIATREHRLYYLRHAIADGATVTTVMAWVGDWRRAFPTDAPPAPPPPAPSAPIVVEEAPDPMRCYVCGESNRHIPALVPVHLHCKLAILDTLLAHARGTNAAD